MPPEQYLKMLLDMSDEEFDQWIENTPPDSIKKVFIYIKIELNRAKWKIAELEDLVAELSRA
jgi:hypothetical protein